MNTISNESENLFEYEKEYEEEENFDEGNLDITSKGKVIIEKNDRSLSEFHRWFKEGRLILDPEWQRNFVWKPKRSSRLIESFLKDIPIPVIYLSKNQEGKYEVIDGLQRLTSAFSFFDGEYKLADLELTQEFEGKYFKDLPPEIQYKLQDSTLRSIELSPSTSKDLLFVIFERLNTGGVALNRMEIRNCIYPGSLNILIKELSDNEDFIKAVNQKQISARMKDRELILRFLAFYEKTYLKCKKGLGQFLNDFYTVYQNSDPVKIDEFKNVFKKCMKATLIVFGTNSFRLRSKTGGWNPRLNAAVYQVISSSFSEYELNQITKNADSIYEEYIDMISTDSKWTDSVTAQTAQTERIDYVFKTWKNRLDFCIRSSDKLDNPRVFSKQLKEELFRQNNK
ncbi:DUF262 domain-containing protein, partial [Leptospira santarosai]